MIKTYLKSYLYLLITIITLTIILSLINYFIPFNNTICLICILSISMLFSSIILGKNSKQKAYLEGLKFSGSFLLLITILKILISSEFNYKVIIIYFLTIFTSIIGSMLGINLKKE